LNIAIPYLSALRFSGEDATEFLHNQLSADVLGLANGESTFACYCEPKGRVLALMLVGRVDDTHFVILSGSLADTIAARLKIYVMRAKVSIEVLGQYSVSGVQLDDEALANTPGSFAIKVPGSNTGLMLAETTPTVDDSVGGPVMDERTAAWKASEVQRGIVWLDPASSTQFLPQMLGFDQIGAVNFRKGCYPGQEIVARIHYLGKVKRHARCLHTEISVEPLPMAKIKMYDGEDEYDALVVDSVSQEQAGSFVFVVSRMDPELAVDHFDYQQQSYPLI